jgi:hypothetical protein
VAVLALAAATGGCARFPDLPGFAAVPFTLQLPFGEHLDGSITTRLLRREFQATNARVTCSGSFNAPKPGAPAVIFAEGSNGMRGSGSLEGGSSFGAAGTMSMPASALQRSGTARRAGRSDEVGMNPRAERSHVQGRTVRARLLDSGGSIPSRQPAPGGRSAPSTLACPTVTGTPRFMAASVIGLRRLRDRRTYGAWRRALACLLAFVLIIALVDPALTSPRVGPDHWKGPGTLSLFEPGSTVSAADDPSDRERPGPTRCNGYCPCHAALRPDDGLAVPARVARALEFPLFGDGFRSLTAAPPNEPPRA